MAYLTKTETQIIKLIEQGVLDYTELANRMFVSRNTMETHIARIRYKLECHSLAELVYKLLTTKRNEKVNGQLIAEMGKVFEKFGYKLTTIETTKTTKDKERVSIVIEDNK